jgi:hypothetical protein
VGARARVGVPELEPVEEPGLEPVEEREPEPVEEPGLESELEPVGEREPGLESEPEPVGEREPGLELAGERGPEPVGARGPGWALEPGRTLDSVAVPWGNCCRLAWGRPAIADPAPFPQLGRAQDRDAARATGMAGGTGMALPGTRAAGWSLELA